MATWTLIDADANQALTAPNTLATPGQEDLAVRTHRLSSGLSAGVDLLEVTNGDFTLMVVPTRGMSVHRAKFGDEFIGWKSPVPGPVHPSFVDLGEPSGLGWLDGFDELLVRCGLESNGAPEHDPDTGRLMYPLHGRIGNKPARRVTVSIEDDEITVTGVMDEIRFHFLKLRLTSEIRLRQGEAGFRIHDTVENLSESPAEMQLLYHTNFGVPLLDAGAQVIAPVKTLVPRNDHAATGVDNWHSYQAPQAGFEEQVYFFELLARDDGTTRTMLKNAHGTRGAALDFNVRQLPVFTLWKNTTSVADGCVTGLEPGTNFPNPRTYEGQQGRTTKLPPRGAAEFDFALNYLANAAQVTAAEAEIRRIQAGTEPTVHRAPQPGWCAP